MHTADGRRFERRNVAREHSLPVSRGRESVQATSRVRGTATTSRTDWIVFRAMSAKPQPGHFLSLRFKHQREGPRRVRRAEQALYDQLIPAHTGYVDERAAVAEEEIARGQTGGGVEEGKQWNTMSSHLYFYRSQMFEEEGSHNTRMRMVARAPMYRLKRRTAELIV